MNLPQFSIKRPVTTTMIYLGLLLLGFISLQRLPRELFPPITYPQITISTSYQNAAPEEIETLITKPLEEIVGTVSGLRRINSVSKEGLSLITLEFLWGTNMDFASLNVRERIDLIKEILPRDADEPLIVKFNPFEMPVMILSVTENVTGGDTDFQQAELLRISRKYIKDALDKVNGVAYSRVTGGLEREILVELDQGRLFASSISILDAAEAIRRANLNYPAGAIKGDFYEYLIRTMGEFKEVSEINDVPVSLDEFIAYSKVFQLQEKKKEQRRLIFLSDVGTVKDTYKEVSSYSRYNGKSNVSISIYKQSGSNSVEVADTVKNALVKLKETLPKDIQIKAIYDQSSFIKGAINGVTNAAIIGSVLAFLVLLVFLQNYRDSTTIVVSIPISIVVVFGLMYMKGITLNMISLGGLALGVGMLVDNSIVVIENISRHLKEKKEETIGEAAVYGSNEVFGAITSSTLTTVAVFIPMIFIVGIAGQLFKELAFTVTYSLLVSLVVALTVVPLMCSGQEPSGGRSIFNKLLAGRINKEKKERRIFKFLSFFIEKIEEKYTGLLKFFLNNKRRGLGIISVIFVISLFGFFLLDKELLPKVDEGQFTIKMDMPTGTLLEVTDENVGKIEGLLLRDKNIEDVMVNAGSSRTDKIGESLGSHQAEVLVNLVEKKKRKIKTGEFISQFKDKIAGLDLKVENIEYVIRGSVLQVSAMEQAPIVIEIKGGNLKVLSSLADDVRNEIKRLAGVYGVQNTLEATSPETKVEIIKDKAWLYDLSVADIARSVQAGLKGYIPTKFKEEGEEIDVRVRLSAEDRKDILRLSRLVVHSPLGIDLPLTEVANLSQGKGPAAIKRMDRERVVMVTANFAGRKFSKVVSEINKRVKDIKVPSGYIVKLGGENEEMGESFASLRFALILSFVLIYMIMAAQFESLWQPFIIMFTVPLSIIGVVTALLVSGTAISVTVLFGIIILGGIVVNNGIVLIDYVNLLVREKGKPVYESLVEAGRVRLRPVLMTSLTTILGLVPLAFGIGDDSGIQAPMAVTVMGGLAVSTFLTLLVIPALYLISYKRKG